MLNTPRQWLKRLHDFTRVFNKRMFTRYTFTRVTFTRLYPVGMFNKSWLLFHTNAEKRTSTEESRNESSGDLAHESRSWGVTRRSESIAFYENVQIFMRKWNLLKIVKTGKFVDVERKSCVKNSKILAA